MFLTTHLFFGKLVSKKIKKQAYHNSLIAETVSAPHKKSAACDVKTEARTDHKNSVDIQGEIKAESARYSSRLRAGLCFGIDQ